MVATAGITVAQRRARLGRRHHLATRAATVEQVVTDLVGLHSSDPATVFLAARARVRGFTPAALEQALYDERTLLRMHGMRRTMFVVDHELGAVMHAACTRSYLTAERHRLVTLLEEQGVARDGNRWLRRVSDRTVAAIEARGTATATELTKAVPELGEKLVMGEGTKWAATVGVSTRVLFLLATEGRIVRGRPRGQWLSSQYEWASTRTWIDPVPSLAPAEARVALLSRWLRGYGPATLRDITWFTGWTQAQGRAALAALDAVDVALDDGVGYLLPDDLASVRAPRRWVALLPALDPTVMGWKERDWYLGAHVARVFDRNGNAGPTIWADGRIVGGWGQCRNGVVAVELLEPVDATTERGVEREAAALTEWLGGTVVTPRFRTPIEQEIAAR
jgi:hypothetical protein